MSNERSPAWSRIWADSKYVKYRILSLSAIFLILWASVTWEGTFAFDSRVYDSLHARLAPMASSQIVVLNIDEQSLTVLGQWPWSRDVHARMVRLLTQWGAKGVIFAINFSEATSENADQQLIQAIAANQRVAIPIDVQLLPDMRVEGELPRFSPQILSAARYTGHLEAKLEPDGVLRGFMPKADYGGEVFPSLLTEATKNLMPADSPSRPWLIERGAAEFPTTYSWLWTVRRNSSHELISFADALSQQINPAVFADKLVVVGVTAPGISNAYITPNTKHTASALPELVAQQLDAVLHRRFITQTPASAQLAFAMALGSLAFLALPLLSVRQAAIFTVAASSCILVATITLLLSAGIWWPPGLPLLCLTICLPVWSFGRMKTAEGYLEDELAALTTTTPAQQTSSFGDRIDVRIEQVMQLRQELEQERSLREEMQAFISHDLRSPLGSIIVMLENLEGNRSANYLETALPKLERSTRRALHLVDSFQALGRAQAIDPGKFQPVCIMDMLDEVVDESAPRAKKNLAAINTTYRTGTYLWSMGDSFQLYRLFNNLVNNAIAYGDKGEPITLACRVEGHNLRVAVASVGQPISDADASRLFEKYIRGAGSRARASTGSGLGLSIANAIVQKHGGSICLERPMPRTSVFEVTLPLCDSGADEPD